MSPNREEGLEITPLPTKQLVILCLVRLAEPINYTILFPFMYRMVRWLKVGESEEDVGSYAGLVAASFAIAQFFSGVPWGWLSDRIGRKPVILMGLLGSTIGIIMFGLSQSYAMAIISRSIAGILNGNIGVIKSLLAEITDKTNRAKAFSLLPLVWGIGSVVGPLLGGLLSEPATQYPSVFGNNAMMLKFPYLLPCLVGSCISLAGSIFGFFFLEETLERKVLEKKQKQVDLELKTSPQVAEEHNKRVEAKEEWSTVGAEDEKKALPHGSGPSLRTALTTPVQVVVLSYVLFSLQNVTWDELYNLWTAAPIEHYGLGLNQAKISITLAIVGILTPVVQLLIYPPLQRRFGDLTCYRVVLFVYIPFYVFQPFVADLAKYGEQVKESNGSGYDLVRVGVWAGVGLCLVTKVICSPICFTATSILLTDVCKDKGALGTVNGYSQAVVSLTRAVGPAMGGALLTLSIKSTLPYPLNNHLVWNTLALIALVTWVESFWVKAVLRKKRNLK
ncbi:MFS general substrate transporter [Basidiobolus meristosporus CBS 931.73]|uniref:MFS general substrate transporter n=1 Tax=Basidiobolus meristosporus CBS 931.73 TaxID=1314790 RepID=A0A1Y1Z834_9FUNG|nr:MFS general substrate transporter [Basidiobolus meristosporus CBS 931.73]|eukprot:ORY05975.1 MFS general substrate transporter [Basidiobolus meristosporus CBS 931.73]